MRLASPDYAAVFLAISLGFAWGAAALPWEIAWIFAWAACSFAFVAAAFLAAWNGPHGKRRDGTLAWWGVVLTWPYLALMLLTQIVALIIRSDDHWNEVAPGVFLGRQPALWERRLFAGLPAVAVVDLTAEFLAVSFLRHRGAYLALPTLDTQPPTLDALQRGADFIEQHRGQGGVYVHCAAGRGRSATVVAAWMLASGRAASVDEAQALLRQNRPWVAFKAGQRAVLEQFQAQISPR